GAMESTVNALTSELRDLRAQREEAAAAHAQEVRRLQEQARDLGKQRDSCLREAEELRTQLRLLEDARDGLRRELLEAQRKLRESQEGREVQRQEAGEW
uniref:Rootletin n=1 Tax=Homo sapiens TaxID=9606 RepID=UPI0015E26F2C